MSKRLQDKVAIVSGGASGMGAAEVVLFAREGAKVVILDLREDLAESVVLKRGSGDGEIVFVQGDVTQEAAWEQAVKTTINAFGRLDILINNAGISPLGLDPDSLKDWHHVMDVNMTSAFLGTKYASKAMQKSGGGSIVNIASILTFVGDGNLGPSYGASKGALWSFTKQCALRYAKDGIRVNSVHPGYMPRMLQRDGAQAPPIEVAMADRYAKIPLGRTGRVEEVAYGVLFLASDEASYITGTHLVIDGGFLAT